MSPKAILAIIVIIILVLNIIFYIQGMVSTLLFWIIILVAGVISLVLKKERKCQDQEKEKTKSK
jgi:Flp pilus assembly protein TadB